MDSLGHRASSWQSLVPAGEQAIKSSEVLKASSSSHLDNLPSFLRGHVDIFRKLSAQTSLPPSNYSKLGGYVVRPAVDLINLIKREELNPSNMDINRSELLSYKTLLEILASVAHEDAAVPRPGGYYASLCFDPSSTSSPSCLRTELVYAIRHYFESQILMIWTQRLLDSGTVLEPVHVNQGHNTVQILRSYITYLHQGKLIPNHHESTALTTIGNHLVSVWVYVYHSIRIGELTCAIQELERVNVNGNHDVIIAAISVFDLVQKKAKGQLSKDATIPDLNLILTKCKFFFHQEISADHKDNYKELVLNLLSLADQDTLTESEAIMNLEDFLWANLWFEYFSLAFLPYSNAAVAQVHLSSSLYERILSFGGAAYYDEDGSSPFMYATVLFACERFGDAINYLWKASRSLQAAHLMLVCLHYGLILPQNPLTCNPRRSLAIVNKADDSIEENMHDTPLSVLTTFTALNFNQQLAEVSVDYCSFLRTRWHDFCTNIDAELLTAQEFKASVAEFEGCKKLLLSLSQNQLKAAIGLEDKKTGLYRYFDSLRVKRLLGEAAQERLRYEPADAINMLEHADMLIEALHEICHHLVMSMRSSEVDSWRSIAIRFHEKYLKAITNTPTTYKATNLQRTLTETGKAYMVDLLEILLQLSLFFILANDRKWEDALGVLQEAKLLPGNEVETLACAKRYQEYDQLLLRLLDDVVFLAADCLQMQYETLRYSRNTTSFDFHGVLTTLDMKLALIRNQAKSMALLCDKLSEHFRRKDTVAKMRRLAVNIA
jgi:hypothetical protein